MDKVLVMLWLAAGMLAGPALAISPGLGGSVGDAVDEATGGGDGPDGPPGQPPPLRPDEKEQPPGEPSSGSDGSSDSPPESMGFGDSQPGNPATD